MTGSGTWPVVVLFFVLHVVLVLPVLTPNLNDIGIFDEADYIEMGRRVGAGTLPSLNENPLPAFFFALIYVPFHASDFWFIHSATIGRFVLFVLLWVSSYMVAKRISDVSNPLIMIGFLLLSSASVSLIRNGSHALFSAMSAFALGQILLFHRGSKLRNLWKASVLVGLAFLSRMGEGTLLFGSLIALSILLAIPARRIGAVLAAATVPFVVIVGGYMLTYYFSTGKSPLGTGHYLYLTFEQGHGVAYQDQFPGQNFYVEGQFEARQLFGTPEQNEYSVITAIQRNPTAYVKRVPRLAARAAWVTLGGYGGPLSLWFFLLALQGCIELLQKRQFVLLCIFLSWSSYLVLYVLLVFQPAHLFLPFPVVFCLASIGLTAVVSLPERQRYVWSAMLVGLIVLAIARNVTLTYLYSAVAFLIGLWIVWIVLGRYRHLEVTSSAFVFLFALMLLFREGIPTQKLRTLGIAPDERAVLFLRRNFAEGTPVGAYAPNIPWAAKMEIVDLIERRSELRSEEDLQRWMINNNLEAIYVDHYLRELEPSTWTLIESQIGRSLDIVFSSDNPDVRILRIDRTPRYN